MTASFTVSVYQRKVGSSIELVTLGLGPATQRRVANGITKAEEQLRGDLRTWAAAARPVELVRLDLKRGTRLERVRIEVQLNDAKRRKVSGLCPIIVEPRHAGEGAPLLVCYHPSRQAEWFVGRPALLADAASSYFAQTWANLDDDAIEALWSNTKDSLKVVSFTASERTLLEDLPDRAKGPWDDLEIESRDGKKPKTREALKVLPKLGVDLTVAASGRAGAVGLPRSPWREQLEALLGSSRRQSVIVVGPPGCGKSTLIGQLIHDRLRSDGFVAHKNLDRVTHVWRILGKHLIAGMSRVGQWEQRCVELLDDVRGRAIVLLVPDLHLFGRIGRARDADRALADFFRGPVSRGELVILAECTTEQLRRLEEDDPAFAAAFVRLHVPAASRTETFRMLLARAREIEVASSVEAPLAIDPRCFETILELGDGLFPSHALPGKAVDMLARVASGKGPRSIAASDVIQHLARETGLPSVLLSNERPLEASEVADELAGHVMGQPEAVREVADLVLRIRSGLTDPRRPYGVYLFTGPTGTGKTELAKALAAYLYGSKARLVRFDMSELSGPDAIARLVGDAWNPEGQLTAAAIAQPFSVILLDEIEKAHPVVLNLLLQLFDDGRLTDAAGTMASFTQAVVVMTSNLGARQRRPAGFDEADLALLHDVSRAVREFFPPELFNRIDAVVPFRPLTPEIAIEVTRKELAQLFGRTGLVERNVFVSVDAGVVERVARDSLRAEDGARSIKRFIEDQIATRLGERIAENPGAALQVMRIRDDEALTVESEPLVEASPVAGSYALEGLWMQPLVALRARVPEVAHTLERLASSERLETLAALLREQLGEHASMAGGSPRERGELVYNIEGMRMTIERLHERIESLAVASRDVADVALENAIAQKDVHEVTRRNARANPRPPLGRIRFDAARPAGWWELFTCIAETHILERALDRVTSPDQHAIFVELVAFGAGRSFLKEMTRAYVAARCEVDGVAWIEREEVTASEGAAGVDALLAATPDRVVLKLVGLCIKDYLELETGTHVWQSSVREPELLRVRVTTAPAGVFPRVKLREPPPSVAPVVRTIRFDPPAPRRPPAVLEMEDFVLGIPVAMRVTAIHEAFARLWLLRISRVEPRAGGER